MQASSPARLVESVGALLGQEDAEPQRPFLLLVISWAAATPGGSGSDSLPAAAATSTPGVQHSVVSDTTPVPFVVEHFRVVRPAVVDEASFSSSSSFVIPPVQGPLGKRLDELAATAAPRADEEAPRRLVVLFLPHVGALGEMWCELDRL